MPVVNGRAATEPLRAVHPEAGIVMVTERGHAAGPEVAAAGAQALRSRGVRPEAMLRCSRTTACGCR